ncbi:Protein PES4 [Cyberlindnera fabianii]|uniref:Protein PES4 n=1 Tax=Cyberlindnera fabianii TaxID=36022 RepID=A0A1V2L621_CYBFA|nr:Protein PES4 [Cyberlindnera fabianii]
MTSQNDPAILNSISLNASRERMTELLSDFKKLNFNKEKSASPLSNEPSMQSVISPLKDSADNDESIELVKAYKPQEKLVALYIGDLDPEVTEEKLYNFFSDYKTLSTVKICYLPGTKTSLGYGYVNFSSEADALRAIEDLNYMPLLNKEIRIMSSLKGKEKLFLGTNVYLSNLNIGKVNSLRTFYETFRAHGKILSCKLDLNKSQGFISFEDKQTAHEFVRKMDSAMLFGRRLHCAIHVPKASRSSSMNLGRKANLSCTPFTDSSLDTSLDTRSPANVPERQYNSSSAIPVEDLSSVSTLVPSNAVNENDDAYASSTNNLDFKQVYVKCLPSDITEDKLRYTFSQCGPISDVFLQSVPEFKSSWAMITYKYPSGAREATQMFHRKIFNGRRLTCVKALKKTERQQQLLVKCPTVTINKPSPHRKLYLYNLPPKVNENFFKLIMRGYTLHGTVIRYFISPKASIGFIDFEREDDAKTICLVLNGIDISGYCLKASLTKIEDPHKSISASDGDGSAAPLSVFPSENPPLDPLSAISTTTGISSLAETDFDYSKPVSSTTDLQPRFFSNSQPNGGVIRDPNGGLFRLVAVPFGSDTANSSEINSPITRIPSFREVSEYHGTGLANEPLFVTLEKLAPRYIDFIKYPYATRSSNLKRILHYFMDIYAQNDSSLTRCDLEKIMRGDRATESMFKNKLIETIELLGFNR